MELGRTKKAFCATAFGDVFYWRLGNGPVLLMLHQASQSSEEYAAIAPFLAKHYTVLSIDYPGHGYSDDPTSELNVEDFTQCIVTVLDELDIDSVDICGHHSGGLLAINLAVNFSDRVRRIILSGIGVRTEENVRAFFDTPLSRDLPLDSNGDFLAKSWAVYRKMTSPGFSPDITFRSFIIGLEARRRPYDAHIAMMKWDRTPLLEKIRQPTLLICGEYDHFAETPEQLLQSISDSRLVNIAGGGPFLFQETPAECADAIIRFLDSADE